MEDKEENYFKKENVSISTNGTVTGSFTSTLTSWTGCTTYYVRAYSTNSEGTAYGNEVSFTTTAPCTSATVSDIDGNSYNTVSIGSQCWTKENLKVTKYNDNSLIPLDASGGSAGNDAGETWTGLITGARTVYAHDNNNLTSYGYFYNWYAVSDSRGICPAGWHVPTDSELTTLINFLGVDSGNKSREVGTTYWGNLNEISPYIATNSSGFSLRGGGSRSAGRFSDLRHTAYFWTVTVFPTNNNLAYWYGAAQNNSYIVQSQNIKNSGAYVRCLKD